MDTPLHDHILMSGLDVPFTPGSTRFLSQWLFGQGGGFFTLVATRVEGDIHVGHAVYAGLQSCMTFDRLERTGFLWLADPEILIALRSRLVDLDHREGPLVLPYRRDTCLNPCAAR